MRPGRPANQTVHASIHDSPLNYVVTTTTQYNFFTINPQHPVQFMLVIIAIIDSPAALLFNHCACVHVGHFHSYGVG